MQAVTILSINSRGRWRMGQAEGGLDEAMVKVDEEKGGCAAMGDFGAEGLTAIGEGRSNVRFEVAVTSMEGERGLRRCGGRQEAKMLSSSWCRVPVEPVVSFSTPAM
jgi:hypothetical protein